MSVQTCLNAWHQQAATHALIDEPDFVVLQLGRFATTESGTRKLHINVEVDQLLHVPVFTVGASCRFCKFGLSSPIRQHGATPEAGYYTAVPCESGQLKWQTDDHRKAVPLNEA